MKSIEKLKEAEQLLNEWLVDNTEEVFEEEPEVDEARGLLTEVIERFENEAAPTRHRP